MRYTLVYEDGREIDMEPEYDCRHRILERITGLSFAEIRELVEGKIHEECIVHVNFFLSVLGFKSRDLVVNPKITLRKFLSLSNRGIQAVIVREGPEFHIIAVLDNKIEKEEEYYLDWEIASMKTFEKSKEPL